MRLGVRAAALIAALGFIGLALSGGARGADATPPNDSLNATLWVANSVEFKANAIAMYQLAKIRLDQALADKNWTAAIEQRGAYQGLPPAVILDADETTVDNSRYWSWLIKSGNDLQGDTLEAWIQQQLEEAIPGSVDFTRYADSKGVKVFYVTNRSTSVKAATQARMQALGFPMGGNVDTLLLYQGKPDWDAKKGSRRAFIAQSYRILLLVGDNYGDFTDEYDGSEADRLASLQRNMAHIGHDWIMIANPQYGSFETAPFLSGANSPDEARRLKIDALPGWVGPR
jgi:5'-nucleotidase (lipoprotein e(P4) family)